VVPNAVTAARSGTGKSVTEVQRVVVTATSQVAPLGGQGFFRLRWAHDGEEEMTECLEFGAEAATVQGALEALGYDLDGSGTSLEEGDEGHVLVTREGDASASSGFGYEYTFEFRGVAGVSTVVGNVEQLQAFDGVYTEAATLSIVGDGVPQFYVETVADGQAAWTYDIFFTGPHLANVPELVVLEEG
ncbi:unnamed protein product, partial [Hapterophycus canaliculatus]